MNRREFLHLMGIGTVSVAAPKIIFDMGANLYKYDRERAVVETAQLIADKMIYYIMSNPNLLDGHLYSLGDAYFDADGFACIKGEKFTLKSF